MENFDHGRLVELVRHASGEVFRTMLGFEIADLEAYSEADPPPTSSGILALIGFAGKWLGTGAFRCSAGMGCRIADALFMTEHAAVEEEVLDAVAEMTNMILGHVKTELEGLLGPMVLSIPTVIYGRNFIKRSQGKREWVVVPFECGGERLEVQVCLTQEKPEDHMRHGTLRPYGVGV